MYNPSLTLTERFSVSAQNLQLGKMELGDFRLQTWLSQALAWDLSFGMVRLGSSVRDLWFEIFRLGSFVWLVGW